MGRVCWLALLFACSTVTTVRAPLSESTLQGLQATLAREETLLVPNQPQRLPFIVSGLRLEPDSLTYATGGGRARLGFSQVKLLSYRSTPRGTLEGALIGLLLGGSAGAVIGGASNSGSYAGLFALVGFVVVGGSGLLIGAITGVVRGHEYRFEFE